jgi:plastocyanin
MKTSSRCLAILVVLIAPLLVFYPTVARAATVTVTVANNSLCFSPSSVTIHLGDTVQRTWGSTGHASTLGTPGVLSGLWDSGIVFVSSAFGPTVPAGWSLVAQWVRSPTLRGLSHPHTFSLCGCQSLFFPSVS